MYVALHRLLSPGTNTLVPWNQYLRNTLVPWNLYPPLSPGTNNLAISLSQVQADLLRTVVLPMEKELHDLKQRVSQQV